MSSQILTSQQEDKNSTYNAYPTNRLRQTSLEARRSKPNFSPNVLESVEINDCTQTTTTTTNNNYKEDLQTITTAKGSEIENFENNTYSDPSEESSSLQAMVTPCQDLRMTKTEKQKQCYSSNTSTPKGSAGALKTELSQYKKELNEYNNATKELEQKYMKINVELGELQQTNERFIANRAAEKNSESTDSCRDGSEFSLRRKYTQIFHRGQSSFGLFSVKENSNDNNKTDKFIKDINEQVDNENLAANILRNKQKKSTVEFRFTQQQQLQQQQQQLQQLQQQQQQDEPSQSSSLKSCLSSKRRSNNLNDGLQMESNAKGSEQVYDIYEALLQAMGTQHNHNHHHLNHNHKSSNNDIKTPLKSPVSCYSEKSLSCENSNFDVNDLEKIIVNLQNDQDHYRSVIIEQQSVLQDYQLRCQKAKQIMQTQQNEIEKLTINNQDLQNEVNNGMDQLRLKVEAKLKKVGPLTEKLHQEQTRNQKITKENSILKEHKRALQNQAKELKLKLEDLMKKKAIIFERLKNTERDLRVFRNYNTALKQEKTKNSEEVQRLKEKLEGLQATHKRSLLRQRELNDKQCRDLQKRVHDLELKLGRSNNSTSNLVIERDRLITELQSQINTLVHNFEVSQKHIRILRRHIHNAAGENPANPTTPLVLKRKSFV